MKEVWKDIPGYDDYYKVSNFGRVESVTRYVSGPKGRKIVRGMMLKQHPGGTKLLPILHQSSAKAQTASRATGEGTFSGGLFSMSSPSLIIEGFKPADNQWKKMKAVWDACHFAGVNPPAEVYNFFNGEEPDNAGVRIKLAATYGIDNHGCCEEYRRDGCVEEYRRDGCVGFDIDISNLPKDVKIIRVMISY